MVRFPAQNEQHHESAQLDAMAKGSVANLSTTQLLQLLGPRDPCPARERRPSIAQQAGSAQILAQFKHLVEETCPDAD